MRLNSAENKTQEGNGIRLYLITGFLGAGKTTFIKQFLRLFPFGERVELIVNEFGKEGVDGALLSELGAVMKEINGGSIFCACRMDQFEKALQQSIARQPDIILVEASGMSDPTGVRRLFSQTDRFAQISYQGAVCLVDAVRFPKLYATARTCVRQLSSSDIAIINRTDLASSDQIQQTESLIRGQRPDIRIIKTTFGKISPEFLSYFPQTVSDDTPMNLTADLTLRCVTVSISPDITSYELQKFIEMFAEETFRVKGWIQTREGLVLADCVANVVSVSPAKNTVSPDAIGILTVLSGAGMPVFSSVKKAAQWYPDKILSISQRA